VASVDTAGRGEAPTVTVVRYGGEGKRVWEAVVRSVQLYEEKPGSGSWMRRSFTGGGCTLKRCGEA
jgi:hypothetical protein